MRLLPVAPGASAPAGSPDEIYADLVLPAPPPGSDRATVSLGMVASVDGATAVAGRSAGLGGAADRVAFDRLRAACDAIVVGAGTARAEDYGPPHGSAARREARIAAGLAAVPLLIVVTHRADLDPSARLFAPTGDVGSQVVVATHAAAPAERVAALADVADVRTFGETHVDLAALTRWCHDRGRSRLLCEGGPRLNGALATAEVIDEVFVTLAPSLVAGTSPRLLTAPELPAPRPLDLIEAHIHDSELLLRYRVAR